MYIFLFLVKNNNLNKLIDNFLDDPMNQSSTENDITTWSRRNVMHDSNSRNSRPCRTSGRDFFSKIVFNFLELLYYLFYAYNTDYISLISDFITSHFDFLH